MQLVKRESVDGGNFLKIKDGESMTGVFKGELHSFRIKWDNGRSQEVSEPNKARHNRYKVNFLVKEGSSFVAKTWEFGNSVYDQLYDISLETDISKTKVKITRRGLGMDTSYTLVPLGPIDANTTSQISNVKLNILNDSNKSAENFAPQNSAWDAADNQDAPF